MFLGLKRVLLILITSLLLSCETPRNIGVFNDKKIDLINHIVLSPTDQINYINTRVIVSYDILPIIFQNEIDGCFRYTEQMFSPLQLKFVQTAYVALANAEECLKDPKYIIEDVSKHKDALNIYFFPYYDHIGKLGESPLPYGYNAVDNYIIIYVRDVDYRIEFYYTVAHEVGHNIGGLLHTFEEDFCDDTPFLPWYSTSNLMDYGGSTDVYLTKGQLERAKTMFLAYRRNYIIQP